MIKSVESDRFLVGLMFLISMRGRTASVSVLVLIENSVRRSCFLSDRGAGGIRNCIAGVFGAGEMRLLLGGTREFCIVGDNGSALEYPIKTMKIYGDS